jgi:peptide/nickel transport system permease protein
MQRYIVRRLLQLPLLLLLVAVVAFFAQRLIPGGPLAVYGRAGISPEALEAIRHRLGLDQPLPMQFWAWLQSAVQGDFGRSVLTGQPVIGEIFDRLPATLVLMTSTFLVVLVISVLVGTVSAVRQYSKLDVALTTASFAGAAMPVYWLSLVLILINAAIRNPATGRPFFPIGGMTTPGQPATIPDVLWHLVLPMIALGLGWVSWYSRYVRSSMLDVIHQDYIRTARAKGVSERLVIFKHAFRNASLPLVTVAALDLPFLFAGALFVETIFGWPGMGNYFYQSIVRRDYPVALAAIVVVAFLVIVANLLADIAYAWLDPRVKYSRRAS